MAAGETGCHSYFAYLRVTDADSYYRHLKAGGAEVLSEIEDKPWSMREFALRTPDGHRIMIGHFAESANGQKGPRHSSYS